MSRKHESASVCTTEAAATARNAVPATNTRPGHRVARHSRTARATAELGTVAIASETATDDKATVTRSHGTGTPVRGRSGRHRRPPVRSRTLRRAHAIGLPTLGLPAIILLLLFTISPSDDAATPTAPPTTATSYPMPSLNPSGLPAGYSTTTEDGQIPTGALATAAADPGTTRGLVTLTAAERAIPAPVLTAYQRAATTLATEKTNCHLRWQLLAGIGKVESGNATGHQISPDGTITPTVLGPRLTGGGGFARVLDTDHGAFDLDKAYDRAVGPMQFLPRTWKSAGRDGNTDGTKDPNNIHDAALTTASYLCAHNRDLTKPTQLNAAILAYNPSGTYVRAVLAWTAGYTATTPVPVTTEATTTDSPASLGTPAPSFPIFTLTPDSTTAAVTCPTISLVTSSLTVTQTATTLDLTGRYTTTNPEPGRDATITLRATARTPAGQPLTTTDRELPLVPNDLPILLTQFRLDNIVVPGQTNTIALTLTTTPPGCATDAVTTLTITDITRPAAAPTPTPTSTSPPAPAVTTPAAPATSESTFPIFTLTRDPTTPPVDSPSPSPSPTPTP